MGPMYHRNVDAGHEEWRRPDPECRGSSDAPLFARPDRMVRRLDAQRAGAPRAVLDFRVACSSNHVRCAGDGPAAHPASNRSDRHLDLSGGASMRLDCRRLQHLHAELARNRVVATHRNNPDAGLTGGAFVLRPHAAHPRHLAGDVGDVGTGGDARFD